MPDLGELSIETPQGEGDHEEDGVFEPSGEGDHEEVDFQPGAQIEGDGEGEQPGAPKKKKRKRKRKSKNQRRAQKKAKEQQAPQCMICAKNFCPCDSGRCPNGEANLPNCECNRICRECLFNHSRDSAERACLDMDCPNRSFNCPQCQASQHFDARSNLDPNHPKLWGRLETENGRARISYDY